MTAKLRGVVIGAGYFSQFHFEAWSRMPDVELVGVCDLDLTKAQAAAKRWNIHRAYTQVQLALQELQPDFVDIVTRPDTHLELVTQALDYQCAIICQKPLAPNMDLAFEVVQRASVRAIPLMVHDNFRFQPWYREIKSVLEQGKLGTKTHSMYFRCRPGDGWGPDAYLGRQPYFREMQQLLIFETGVHFIDTFRYLAGEVEQVFSVLRQLNPVIRGEDAGLVVFRFLNGAVGVWDANRYNESTAQDVRYTFGEFLLETDGGRIRLDESGQLFIKPLGQDEYQHRYHPSRHSFSGDCVFQAQRHFIECLCNRTEFETSGNKYLQTLAVQEAVYQSQAINQPVRPAQFLKPPRSLNLEARLT